MWHFRTDPKCVRQGMILGRTEGHTSCAGLLLRVHAQHGWGSPQRQTTPSYVPLLLVQGSPSQNAHCGGGGGVAVLNGPGRAYWAVQSPEAGAPGSSGDRREPPPGQGARGASARQRPDAVDQGGSHLLSHAARPVGQWVSRLCWLHPRGGPRPPPVAKPRQWAGSGSLCGQGSASGTGTRSATVMTQDPLQWGVPGWDRGVPSVCAQLSRVPGWFSLCFRPLPKIKPRLVEDSILEGNG